MGDIKIKTALNGLKEDVSSLASTVLKDYETQATIDGQELVKSLENDLENWAGLLVEGKLTKEDIEFLTMGKKELIEMNGLKQAGLTAARIDQFKISVLQLIVNRISGLI